MKAQLTRAGWPSESAVQRTSQGGFAQQLIGRLAANFSWVEGFGNPLQGRGRRSLLNILSAAVVLPFGDPYALAGQADSVALQQAAVASQGRLAAASMRASVSIQIRAVNTNRATFGESLSMVQPFEFDSSPLAGFEKPECQPLSQLEARDLAARAGTANDLSPSVVLAVMETESALTPCAVSPKGAQGLMQLMPATANALGVDEPFDPELNAFAGAKYLRTLLDRYQGDLERAIAAYNAGPARVDAAGGIPDIPETISYVSLIEADLSRSDWNDGSAAGHPDPGPHAVQVTPRRQVQAREQEQNQQSTKTGDNNRLD